jgi:hypothetical protein
MIYQGKSGKSTLRTVANSGVKSISSKQSALSSKNVSSKTTKQVGSLSKR